MIKYSSVLGLLVFMSGCSFIDWQSNGPKQANNVSVERSIASVEGQTCGNLISYLMKRQNTFSEAQFDDQFEDLGLGYIHRYLEDLSRRDMISAKQASILEKIEDHLAPGLDYQRVLSDFTIEEKQLLWSDIVRPKYYELEEELLFLSSENGDEIASFLLQVPRGAQRENAQEAVILLKQLEPDVDDATIVSRISKEMGACLTR